jgi:CBS domain containing-hemolysin-like protein
MGNTLANILIQNIAANLFSSYSSWLLSVGVPLILTMVVGEIIPKSVAMLNNERLAPKIASPLMLFYRLIRPIRRFLTAIAEAISHSLFLFFKPERDISQEELVHALEVSQSQGVLTEQEVDLVRGYLTFQDAIVKELMRPREEILSYDLADPLSRLTHLFSQESCSRVPVTQGGLEQVKGVIEAQDFFLANGKITTPQEVLPYLHAPFFVPEEMAAKILMRKFVEKGLNLALVVDEYGSLTGLITREDLIETVVGEIIDSQMLNLSTPGQVPT